MSPSTKGKTGSVFDKLLKQEKADRTAQVLAQVGGGIDVNQIHRLTWDQLDVLTEAALRFRQALNFGDEIERYFTEAALKEEIARTGISVARP